MGGILEDTGAGDLVDSGILNGMFEGNNGLCDAGDSVFVFYRDVTFPFPLLYGCRGSTVREKGFKKTIMWISNRNSCNNISAKIFKMIKLAEI